MNAYLSAEQRATLAAIPAAGADPADIIAANQYLCREFIRRGSALAQETDNPWPQAFVDATLDHLRRHFDTDFA